MNDPAEKINGVIGRLEAQQQKFSIRASDLIKSGLGKSASYYTLIGRLEIIAEVLEQLRNLKKGVNDEHL